MKVNLIKALGCGMLLGVLLAGCGSQEVKMQEICVRVGGVRSGDIGTKSAEDALAASVPSGSVALSLKGVDVTTRQFSVVAGETVVVPVGRYRVTGSWEGEQVGEARSCKVWQEPAFSVDQEISVVEGVGVYSVGAQWECWALVLDGGECSKYRHQKDTGGAMVDFAWMRMVGDFGVAYIGFGPQWGTNSPYRLEAVPVDLEGKESVEYRLVNVSSQAGVLVEKGKWYSFGVREVTVQSGIIGVEFPSWIEGR